MKQIIKKNILNLLKFRIITVDDVFGDVEKSWLIPSETILTPEVKSMSFIDIARDIQSESYSTPAGYTTLIKDVLYSPEYNILLTTKREVISDSFIPHSHLEDFNFKINWLYRKNIQTIPGYCMIFDQLAQNNYYHCLVDNIPRFYLGCKNEVVCSGKDIKLLHTTTIDKNPFVIALKPENVNFLKLNIGKLYHLKNLIFSSFVTSHYCGHIPSILRQDIYSRFLPVRPRNYENYIYISRHKAPQGRRILNEGELFSSLSKLGFKKYFLEDLSTSEQIDIFYDAKVVVAPHGAGLTNLIFSHNTRVLELFQMNLITPNYYYLSKSMGHNYSYWCAPVNNASPWSDFTVDLDKVIKLVEKLLIFD